MGKLAHGNFFLWMMSLKMERLSFNPMLVGQNQAIAVNKILQLQMRNLWGPWQNLLVLYDAPQDLDAKSKSWKTQLKCWLYYCNFKALKEYLFSSRRMWDSQLLNSFRVKWLALYPQRISCLDHSPRNLFVLIAVLGRVKMYELQSLQNIPLMMCSHHAWCWPFIYKCLKIL